MAFKYRRLGDIVVDICNARKWYTDLRIKTEGTRLDEISKHVTLDLMNPSTEEGAAFEKGDISEKSFYALSDGASFGLIAAEFAKLKSHLLPKRTIREVLSGPLTPKDEELENSDGRNKFVELELAANLSSTGLNILGFDDVVFEFEGVKYLCECKRPSKSSTLDSNVQKAYSQLSRKLGSIADRGLITVSVEKIFDLDKSFQNLRNVHDVNELAMNIAFELNQKLLKYQKIWIDTRIIGVLAIIRFIAKLPETVIYSYTTAVLRIALPEFGQKSDNDRLLRLTDHLHSYL